MRRGERASAMSSGVEVHGQLPRVVHDPLVPARAPTKIAYSKSSPVALLRLAIFVGTRIAGTQVNNSERAALDSRIARRRRA